MTLEHVMIVVVACFLSTFLIIISCVNSLEKRIDKYHRQELEAIDELKKSLENKAPYFDHQLPDVVREFDPNSWKITCCGTEGGILHPCGTEDDILYPSHSENKDGANG